MDSSFTNGRPTQQAARWWRQADRSVDGEAKRRAARDVEREMGADVDTGQAHEGNCAQGERAAAWAETGQGGGAQGDDHTCVPGQVPEPGGVAAAAADARKQGRRPSAGGLFA